MVSLFQQFSALSCGVLLAACITPACAEPDQNFLPDSGNRWSYDEVIAYVPLEQAAIPSVALAKINIALYHAKQLTEQQLCVGKWTPRGTLLYQQGPEAADNRLYAPKAGESSWFFQSFRKPEKLTCSDATRAEYFMEMSRHLPAWISVRPAGQAMRFRLGQVFTGDQHSLAAR